MYITHEWPEFHTLGLSHSAYSELMGAIMVPFDSLQEAHQFWYETQCQLHILHSTDTTQLTEQQLFCYQNPDFVETLTDHTLHCSIINDAGGGLFLLIPNN